MSSRGRSRDQTGQEEDQEILDDMVFIVKILQVASEEASALSQLRKEANGPGETKAEKVGITTPPRTTTTSSLVCELGLRPKFIVLK